MLQLFVQKASKLCENAGSILCHDRLDAENIIRKPPCKLVQANCTDQKKHSAPK